MKGEIFGYRIGDRIGAGGAERFRAEGEPDGVELWWVPDERTGVATRFLDWGRQGLGGFVRRQPAEGGTWLLRVLGPHRLDEALRDGRIEGDAADALLTGILTALAAAEAASVRVGPLTPRTVFFDRHRARVVVAAEPLLLALAGGEGERDAESDPRDMWWTPPEFERWSAGASRYAAAMMTWTALAGEHPFGGVGLRHAGREAEREGPPPLPEERARTLAPGRQTALLRMLHPSPEARPRSADRALAQWRGEAPRGRAAEVVESASSDPPPPRAGRTARGPGRPRLLVGGLATAAVVVAGALAFPDAAPPPVADRRRPSPLTQVLPGLMAEDCASCHPRQAAEWEQSVMGHSVESPLFNALESLIEEQAGRSDDCPGGAGILRRADPATACREPNSGLAITGSGGEHWCVNCHAGATNLAVEMAPWEGRPGGDPNSRRPVRDSISPLARQGISCALCHTTHGPARPGAGYQGNPDWTSFVTGARFLSRPEDRRGQFGIANSGYRLDRAAFVIGESAADVVRTKLGAPIHRRPSAATKRYLDSSDFCGSCHDVRLFGTDVVGVRRGEHFKRLRNAYTEWSNWARDESAAGRKPAPCQDCHMSLFPGVCEPGPRPDDDLRHKGCPPSHRFVAKSPGAKADALVSAISETARPVRSHWFSGVDIPLASSLPDEGLDRPGVDDHGVPLSLRARRDQLLRSSMRLTLGDGRREGRELVIPVEIENIAAGHKIPAGFSQEREVWVHLRVTDERGRLVYEVGRVDRNDEDLHDKVFLRVQTDPGVVDAKGQPVGLFGADVVDGPDVPQWRRDGNGFVGRGLINFQNGFQRCVRCRGAIGSDGRCLPLVGERHRAERFEDGDYDIDTGECRSNLLGEHALFETYFPVGALDFERGLPKAPDAIIDDRSLLPHRPAVYTYRIEAPRGGPFQVEAVLMFRSFPPFLIRAFAEYEAAMARRGARPAGPTVTPSMLQRLERVVLARRTIRIAGP